MIADMVLQIPAGDMGSWGAQPQAAAAAEEEDTC